MSKVASDETTVTIGHSVITKQGQGLVQTRSIKLCLSYQQEDVRQDIGTVIVGLALWTSDHRREGSRRIGTAQRNEQAIQQLATQSTGSLSTNQ